MGRLYRRHGDGSWYFDIDLPDGRRLRRSTETKDKTVARDRMRRAELDATASHVQAQDPAGNRPRYRLSETLDAVIARIEGEDDGEGTRHYYLTKSRRILTTLGNPMLDEITLDMLEAYVTRRVNRDDEEHGGAKNHTVSKELSVIRRSLKFALRRGWIAALPVFPEISVDYVPKETYLTPEEYRLVLERVAPKRRLWMALGALAGLRKSEIEKVEWANVGEILRVHGTKTKKSRRNLPIAPALRALLDAVPESQRVGRVVEKWPNVRHDLRRACREAHIDKKISPNDLRRTFSSWLVQMNVPTLTVATLMGHASTRMVELVYGRLSPEQLTAAIAAVPALQSGGETLVGRRELAVLIALEQVAGDGWTAEATIGRTPLGSVEARRQQDARRAILPVILRALADAYEEAPAEPPDAVTFAFVTRGGDSNRRPAVKATHRLPAQTRAAVVDGQIDQSSTEMEPKTDDEQ